MLLRTWMRNTRMMQPSRTSSRGRLLRSSMSPTLIFPTVRSFFSRERQTYLILYCEVFRFYDCRIFPGSASLLVLAIYHGDGPSCPPEPSGNPKFRSHKCCPSSVSAVITWVRIALPNMFHVCITNRICFTSPFFEVKSHRGSSPNRTSPIWGSYWGIGRQRCW